MRLNERRHHLIQRKFMLGLVLLGFGCGTPQETPPQPVSGPRMMIEADPRKLDAYGLPMDKLVRRLREEGVEILSQRATTLEVGSKVSPESLMNLIIDTQQGAPIRLHDIARMELRPR